MLTSIIVGVLTGVLFLVTYILGDRKGFTRGVKTGATEMNKFITEKYSNYVMLTKEGFHTLAGCSVEEYQAMMDLYEQDSKEEEPEATVSHLKAVKEDEDGAK